MVVKLYYDHLFPLASQKLRWQNFDERITLQNAGSFADLASKSRLVVFSYDSTGVLELLSRNEPVIAFWQDGLAHVREESRPFYERLIEVGIVHTNIESIACLINTKWDSIDTWWQSHQIQSARLFFCNEYSRITRRPVRDLYKILKEQLASELYGSTK